MKGAGSFPQGTRARGIPALCRRLVWGGPVLISQRHLLRPQDGSAFWVADPSHFLPFLLKDEGGRGGIGMRFWEAGKSVCRMHGLGSWVFTCGCVPSCATQPSLHPLYPTLPACNVTIHNRCKDTLANCTKVKQKVRGQGGPRVGERAEIAVSVCFSVHSLPYVPVLAMGQPRPAPLGHSPA